MIWGGINTKIGKARLFIKDNCGSISSTVYAEDILDRLLKPLPGRFNFSSGLCNFPHSKEEYRLLQTEWDFTKIHLFCNLR